MDAAVGGRRKVDQGAAPMPVVLYERGHAMTAIDQVVESACNGSGGATFVRGDAGLGKTSLLRLTEERAPDQMSVHWARGSQMEADLPLAFVEQLVGTSDRVGFAPTTRDPLDRRSAVHQFARAQLGAWAGGGPLLVLLDDLHWADQDSLDVVAFLARRLASLPVALVGVLRSWPRRATYLVNTLVRDALASVTDVSPLTRSGSDRLLNDLLDDSASDATEHEVWTIAQGNPFLVDQAARVVRREGGLPTGPGARWAGTLVLSKLAGLPPQTVECARAAAVLGGRTDLTALQAVAALDETAFVDAFDTLVAAGVLHNLADDDCEISHDLLTQTIVHDMGPARRRLLHLRAFEHYHARHDTARAASHALTAQLHGDEQALTAVTEAGIRALSGGAIETGLRYLSGALDLAAPEPPESLLTQYADALFTVGRAVDALEIYQRIAGRSRTVETAGRVARTLAYVGRFDESLAAYAQVLADRTPGPARDAGLLERAHVVWERDGPAAALANLDGVRVDPPDGRFGMLLAAIRAYARLQTGDPRGVPDIETAAANARERLRAADDVGLSMNALSLEVSAFASLERHDEALTLADDGIRALRKVGALRAMVPLRITRIGILSQRGRLTQAVAESLQLEAETEIDPLSLPTIRLLRAQALTWLGSSDGARSLCDEVEGHPTAGTWFSRLLLGTVRADLLLQDQRLTEALEKYREVEDLAHRFAIGEPCTPMWAAGAIEAALAVGSARDATRIVRWLDDCCSVLHCARPKMVALAGKAGCAALVGDDALAEDLYQQALAVQCSMPLERSTILLRYGAWLRRRGHAQRSRQPLALAAQLAHECGAQPLAQRAQDELTVAGGRRRPAHPPTSLTHQEVRVAALAASGSTSREIAEQLTLSTRTVDSHLAHVYRKLDVRSRRDLRLRRAELETLLDDRS